MDFKKLFELKRLMLENGMVLGYSGPVSQSIIVEIGEALQSTLQRDAKLGKSSRRVFSIFIELLQNILHYSIERTTDEPAHQQQPVGVSVVGTEDDNIYVMSGNVISSKQRAKLESYLAKVNAMNADELKALHKEVRKRPMPTTASGAGLGIIDIARKSGNPLHYEFYEIGPDELFFSVKAIITPELQEVLQ
jgi:hypothetical protein